MNPRIIHITPLLTEIFWDEKISNALLEKRLALLDSIKKELSEDILDLRSGYNSIAIRWKSKIKSGRLEELTQNIVVSKSKVFKTWEIPVCYGERFGKDLSSLANAKSLSEDQIIQLHSEENYRIHFYGFLPGFMYLSGLRPELHERRKPVPDRNVPAGSVAIGGAQTGIYPSSSPGGWHLIGQTPLVLFDPSKPQPVGVQVGDWIRFRAISAAEFFILKSNPIQPKAL